METAMGDVTRNDLDHMRDRLEALVRDGFVGVHSRLDKLNGRTGATEVNVADIKPRLAHVEREMGEVRGALSDISDQVADVAGTVAHEARQVAKVKEESGENRRITSRDVAIVLAAIAITVSVLAFMGKLQ